MKKTIYFLLITIILVFMSGITLADENVENASGTSITSDSYIISKTNSLVSRILPKTTISKAKEKFNVDSRTVHVYSSDGRTEVTEGYIGTGMKIRFDNHDSTYTVSVIGDLTGDGEIKQIEVSKAIKHVIGLTDHQLIAENAASADINGDGLIDQKDVSLLIRYVVYGELEIGEMLRPSAPLIEVQGTAGEDGWYTSNVSVTVSIPRNTPVDIEGLSYTKTGTSTQEETIIQDGGTIELDQEGEYELKCYSISKTGVKSLAGIKKIKIDKTAPEAAELIGQFKDANGERYDFNTTSHQDIYLTTTKGEDLVSGIKEVTIEATGKNRLPAGTKTPVTIKEQGSTDVIVTTKNTAGLTSTRLYTIIIDKVIKNPGTVITKLNDQNGESYTQDTWTNQNVYVEVNKTEGVKTTYKVSEPNKREETEEPTVLTEEGISTITVKNIDQYGNISTNDITVKIDKQPLEKPTLTVTGDKEEDSNWYTANVKVKMSAAGENNGAKVEEIEYSLKNKTTNTTTDGTVKNNESIDITTEGIYELEACTIDEAGNRSVSETQQINLDTTDPTAGTMRFHFDGPTSENMYTSEEWTNKDVFSELINGAENDISGHKSTVYKITDKEGNLIEDNINGPRQFTNQNEYTVEVTTTDNAGRKSNRTYKVKIDKTKPESPSIEVISGSKSSPNNEWYYKDDVQLQITTKQKDSGGSGYKETKYEITGSSRVEKEVIENGGRINISTNGTHDIYVYDYDEAGNESDPTKITIKLDKTPPTITQFAQSNVTGTSFRLSATVQEYEQESGPALYQFYVDGKIYKEIQSNQLTETCDVINQESKQHSVQVFVKDVAGNIRTSSILAFDMGRLTIEDIDHIEFAVNRFTIKKNNATVTTGAEPIISDTSISESTKYIQINSSVTGTEGKLEGKINIIRKNGQKVEERRYYPHNLTLSFGRYYNGSGSSWSHEGKVYIAGSTLTNTGIAEGNTVNSTTSNIYNDNNFWVSDKKGTTGTKTYTMLILKEMSINGQTIPFSINGDVIT
ncbi:MAG: hypothetical protein HFJ17_01455 [Clostridia bacterium]|nr:hypothetical protein [Clostridia bacterium]